MDVKRTLDAVEGLEEAAMAMLEDFKYMPIGQGKEQAVLLLQYLLPLDGMALFLAQRGWRRHDDLALIKPRKVVGGMFEDLVAYVPVDDSDGPVVVPPTPYEPDRQLSMSDLPWSVKPTLSEQFEERPSDE
jgi:hypothetical protein